MGIDLATENGLSEIDRKLHDFCHRFEIASLRKSPLIERKTG